MIAASLVAIALVGWFLYQYQNHVQEEKTRIQGVAITRALSSAQYSELVAAGGLPTLMRGLVSVQGNDNFAYGVAVDLAGKKLYETTSAGTIAPAATMPREPFAWFGEHQVTSPGDGRQIREFFSPIMKDGEHAGFVRVGYYRQPASSMSNQVFIFGLMALPIFLLTTLSYFLIRREIRPLAQLSDKMDQASRAYGAAASASLQGQDLGDFVQRFDQFIELVQSRVRQLDQATVSTQVSTRLLSYRQEKAESALNSIPDAILVIDEACIPTYSNQKLEHVLGVKRDEIIGKQPSQWCKNKEVLAFLMRFKSAAPATRLLSMEYVAQDNPDQRISVAAFPLFSPRDRNTLFGMLVIFRDISKEYLAKQAGVEFVARISHELKTPLQTIAAYSELLLDQVSLPESEKVDAVNVIHGEVQRMAGLINNLLNISKMESGTLRLERKRVKLHDLMLDAFASMRNNALGRQIELELAIPPDLGSVRLDKDMFRIAVDNLLSNAIKYSNPGGRVTVSAGLLENGQMEVKVQDRGIGISSEDCNKVFTKYYRASNDGAEARSGHGLGLYLAKQIIELHHGTIKVASELGKGTEFVITFKAQPVQLEESNLS